MILLFSSCSQDLLQEENELTLDGELTSTSFRESILITPNHPILDDSQAKLLEEISKKVILLGRNPEFKESIFNETVKQKSGDYDVELSDLSKNLKIHTELTESLSQISSLSQQFEKESNGVKLKLYYPRAATFEKQGITKPNFEGKSSLDTPEIVIMNTFNEDYSSPAYQLDEKGDIVFAQNVTEEYANNNDIYVIGSESITTIQPIAPIAPEIDPDDPTGGGGGGPTPTYTYRTEGRPEYGGKIQVTDMNAIEHWTAGKFEFRVIVFNATGKIIKDKRFNDRARDNFKDKRWYDFNEFYFNWYQSNIGAYTIEKWIEIDDPIFGSAGTEVTISVPPATSGGPTTTIKYTTKESDDDLGLTIIQFPDRVGQSYGLNHMNIKRK